MYQRFDEIPTFHNLVRLKLHSINYNWSLFVQMLNHCPNLQNVELCQVCIYSLEISIFCKKLLIHFILSIFNRVFLVEMDEEEMPKKTGQTQNLFQRAFRYILKLAYLVIYRAKKMTFSWQHISLRMQEFYKAWQSHATMILKLRENFPYVQRPLLHVNFV